MTGPTWAFTNAYNEAILAPFWVRHYRTFCDRVIVYVDADSTDGTAELVEAEGGEARPYRGSGLDDGEFVTFAQEHYKEARGSADWVCWTDADEFLYHPHMRDRLAGLRTAGANVAATMGYTMFADQPPTGPGQIVDQIRMGVPAPEYSKLACFDPNLDVQWTPGKHAANIKRAGPPGTEWLGVGGEDDPLKLLHMRWLGEDWFRARHARNWARQPQRARDAQWGYYVAPDYNENEWYGTGWFRELARQAQDVIG